MKVRNIMTREVETAGPSDTALDVARRMKVRDLGSMPICEDGQVLGVITDREMTLAVVAEGRDPAIAQAKDIMLRNVVLCREDDSVSDVTKEMEQKQAHRALRGGRQRTPRRNRVARKDRVKKKLEGSPRKRWRPRPRAPRRSGAKRRILRNQRSTWSSCAPTWRGKRPKSGAPIEEVRSHPPGGRPGETSPDNSKF